MTARVEVFETETERGLRFPSGMSVAARIEAALEYFDASLVEDLAAVERDIRAEYVVDDEDVDAMMSLVRAKAAVRRTELIARIERGGAPLQ
jgi:enamine deaminase RidA (YjgF/YER057c/UK114 family)